jgi:nicotinic acid mononucleotide adenylyltransferase
VAGVGAYPGSFNPATIAHLAVAEAAVQHARLERVDLIVSRVALGKGVVERPRFEDRIMVLDQIASTRPWLGVQVTDAQLLADLAEGYDVLIVGADKWAQVIDPHWYGDSLAARDAALARLPRVLIAPRPPFVTSGQEVLSIAEHHRPVSSTAARSGRRAWMAPEAADFDAETGAWSEPERYDRWRSRQPR